jgi:hypothetical protein
LRLLICYACNLPAAENLSAVDKPQAKKIAMSRTATKVKTAEIGFMVWHFLWVSDPGL